MIWVPIVCSLVFILIIISLVIVGFYVSWKSALFISVVFLIFNSLWLMIILLTYDLVWWDIYRDLFVESRLSDDSNFSVEALSSYYKPTVVVVFLTFFAPLSAVFTWIIYRACKYKLNKYLSHKVKTKKSYEKIIIKHKRRLYARYGGSLTLGITGIFVGSLVVSSLNVFFTPYYKSSSWNKFNDFLAKIYTYGQAGNSNDVQVLHDFLASIDSNMVEKSQQLVHFQTSERQENFLPPIESLNYLVENISKFSELFKYEVAAEAIFAGFFANLNWDINLFLFDQNIATQKDLNSQGNITGYNKAVLANDLWWNDVLTYFNDNPFPSEMLPNKVKNLIFEQIKKSITSFEDLLFAKEVKGLQSLINSNQKIIDQRQDERQKVIKENQDTSLEIKNLIIELNALSGLHKDFKLNPYDITKQSSWTEYQNINLGPRLNPNDLSKITTDSKIGKSQAKINNDLQPKADQATTDFNQAEKNFISFRDGEYYSARIKQENAKALYEANVRSYQRQERAVAQLERELEQLKKDQESKSAIENKERELATGQEQLNNLVAQREASKSDYQIADQQFLEKTKQLEQLQAIMNTKENVANNSQQNLNQEIANRNDLVNQYNTLIFNTLEQYKNTLQTNEQAYLKLENKDLDLNPLVAKHNIYYRNFVEVKSDDGSIYWAQKHQEFLSKKLIEVEKISEDKKVIYNNYYQLFTSELEEWIFGKSDNE